MIRIQNSRRDVKMKLNVIELDALFTGSLSNVYSFSRFLKKREKNPSILKCAKLGEHECKISDKGCGAVH